jgi:hypothetical protein
LSLFGGIRPFARDCLYALQPAIPHLTRSPLYRSLQRHGITRLPEVEGRRPPAFEEEVQGLSSKFAFVQLVRKTGRNSALTSSKF